MFRGTADLYRPVATQDRDTVRYKASSEQISSTADDMMAQSGAGAQIYARAKELSALIEERHLRRGATALSLCLSARYAITAGSHRQARSLAGPALYVGNGGRFAALGRHASARQFSTTRTLTVFPLTLPVANLRTASPAISRTTAT